MDFIEPIYIKPKQQSKEKMDQTKIVDYQDTKFIKKFLGKT